MKARKFVKPWIIQARDADIFYDASLRSNQAWYRSCRTMRRRSLKSVGS